MPGIERIMLQEIVNHDVSDEGDIVARDRDDQVARD